MVRLSGHACMLSHFNRVQLFATLWIIANQTPLSMGFSRQEHWSGLPCFLPGEAPWVRVAPWVARTGGRILNPGSCLPLRGTPAPVPPTWPPPALLPGSSRCPAQPASGRRRHRPGPLAWHLLRGNLLLRWRQKWSRESDQEASLEKEMTTHSSIFAWRIPGTTEPGGLPSMGSHRVGHD